MANGGDLESFFLRHSILREPDDDEVGPRARNEAIDPDASDDEGPARESMSDKWAKLDLPDPLRRAVLAGNSSDAPSHRTGPKGVKADYEEAKAIAAHNAQVDAMQRQALLNRIASGVVRTDGGPVEAPALAQGFDEPDSCDELEDDEDDEDEFLARYRAQRLAQMQSVSTLPSFGQIREVDPFQFVDEVNDADPRVFVVVHLYESFVSACEVANRHLEALARKYPHVKFLRLQASSAQQGFDNVALPVLNIYRGGDLVTCLVHITDDIGLDFGEGDLEWLLDTYDVLQEYDPAREAEQKRAQAAAERREEAQTEVMAARLSAAMAQAEEEGMAVVG